MTDQTHQIPSQLQMGKDHGMQLLDQALLAAITAKEIDPEQRLRLRHRQAPVPEVRDRHEHAAPPHRHPSRRPAPERARCRPSTTT